MLNKQHNLKSGKTKIRKRDLKGKTRQETIIKEKLLMKNELQFNVFMLFFSENKGKEERTMKKRQKQETKRKQKRKQKRKTRRKKERQEQERDRERETEKGGGQNRLREKEREAQKINKKKPFLGGNRVFLLKAKKGKEQKKTKINKEGLGPSEVALWATSPDP